jgi:hypothetical protein
MSASRRGQDRGVALPIFLTSVTPVGVKSRQGRSRKGTFILTLDSFPRHFMIELGTKRDRVQLRFVA